jgi:aminopeptidase N
MNVLAVPRASVLLLASLLAGATRAQEAAAAALPDGAGALGLGDPYFPEIGNGGYDVEHYALVLDVEMDADEVQAEATIRARATQDLARFSLDLHGLTVERVLVDGVEAPFERPPVAPGEDGTPRLPTELVILPAKPIASGATFETRVTYSGSPSVRPDPSVPFLPGVGWMRGESGVYVVSECIGASSWYPCNDHPIDKATYSFRVTVDEPWIAAANGILTGVEDLGERRTFVFEARDPMASYLATLNIAEFGVLELEGPRGIPMTTYHPKDATEEELAPFKRQREVFEFLEATFGPYPFEAAGAVLSYESLGGALECQTLPVYSRGSDLGTIVHEIAHQWYGNSVSPELWRDMWLNEGFASYAGWLWTEHADGKEAYQRTAARTYRRLRERKTGSPYDPGVAQVFSGRVYTRGAFVLHGLRREVGDDAFFRILREWERTNHDAHGSTQEFVAHASATADRDLGAFFDLWLFAAVTPEVPEYEAPEAGADEERPRRRRDD